MDNPQFKRAAHSLELKYKRIMVTQSTQVWMHILGCGVLVYFGQYRWVWVVIALMAMRIAAEVL